MQLRILIIMLFITMVLNAQNNNVIVVIEKVNTAEECNGVPFPASCRGKLIVVKQSFASEQDALAFLNSQQPSKVDLYIVNGVEKDITISTTQVTVPSSISKTVNTYTAPK